ncbi:MAG TPA: glycosyltransferase [bacterium]|nr:glycosyltransferase [bacterium]
MITACCILLILYALFVLYTVGGQRYHRHDLIGNPFVSIVIPARNEALHLRQCLDSLETLDYPESRMEIILVDDRSVDETGRIMDRFAKNHPRRRVIHIHNLPPGRTGKSHALIVGTKQCGGEFLFFTDADCTVPPRWIQAHVRAYTPSTGLCGGSVRLNRKGSPAGHRLQSLEWLHLASVGWGWAGRGIPLSVFGNNLSVRREAFQASGGFDCAAGHPLEDFALARRVHKHTPWSAAFTGDKEAAVCSRPLPFTDWIAQQRRWAVGGRLHRMPGLGIMTLTFCRNLMMILLLTFGNWQAALFLLTGSIAADGFLMFRLLKNRENRRLLPDLPLYEILLAAGSLLIAPVMLLARTYTWKETVYMNRLDGKDQS